MSTYKMTSNLMIAKIVGSFKIFIFTLLFIPIVNIIYLRISGSAYMSYENLEMSLADFFIIGSTPWFFSLGISFISMYLALHMAKYDYNSTCVIIYRSKMRLWINQIACITGVSLFITIYDFLVVFIIGISMTDIPINWSSLQSCYFLRTKTLTNTKLWEVMLLFIATIFFINMIIISITLLSKWVFNNLLPGLLLVAILIWADLSGGIQMPLIFNGLSIVYSPLLINMSYSGVVFGAAILLLLWLIGFICAKEREFYDVS